jgi:hypothetical protein
MQRRSHTGLFLLILAGMVLGGLAFLTFKDIPSPMQPVEKPLDAKAFLNNGQ